MIERPAKPPPPQESQKRKNSLTPVLLVFAALVAICSAIWLLTMGFFGFVLAVLLATSGFIGLHYAVWGWWLSDIIRREEAETDETQ